MASITFSVPAGEHTVWSQQAAAGLVGQTFKWGEHDGTVVAARFDPDNPSIIGLEVDVPALIIDHGDALDAMSIGFPDDQ